MFIQKISSGKKEVIVICFGWKNSIGIDMALQLEPKKNL